MESVMEIKIIFTVEAIFPECVVRFGNFLADIIGPFTCHKPSPKTTFRIVFEDEKIF
jgi:hypothetical protein